jgi:translocation protein SEC63
MFSSLLRSLSAEELKIINSVANKYPLMKITKAKFSVIGEPFIIPSSLVTLVVELKLLSKYEPDSKLDTSDSDGTNEQDEPLNKKWWVNTSSSKLEHTPYFPEVLFLLNSRKSVELGGLCWPIRKPIE